MTYQMRKMKKMMINDKAYRSLNIRTIVPEGTMYVTVVEDEEHRASQIFVSIGKAGAQLSAWADALGRLATVLLESGIGINTIIEELSSLTSDKVAINTNGEEVHSGPEGLAMALIKYKNGKFQELKESLNDGLRVDTAANE